MRFRNGANKCRLKIAVVLGRGSTSLGIQHSVIAWRSLKASHGHTLFYKEYNIRGSGEQGCVELNCRAWNASHALPSLETSSLRAGACRTRLTRRNCSPHRRRHTINSPVPREDGFIFVAGWSDGKLDSRRAPPVLPLSTPLGWVLEFREEIRIALCRLATLGFDGSGISGEDLEGVVACSIGSGIADESVASTVFRTGRPCNFIYFVAGREPGVGPGPAAGTPIPLRFRQDVRDNTIRKYTVDAFNIETLQFNMWCRFRPGRRNLNTHPRGTLETYRHDSAEQLRDFAAHWVTQLTSLMASRVNGEDGKEDARDATAIGGSCLALMGHQTAQPVYGEPRWNSAASHAHSTTRHILASSAMSSTDYSTSSGQRWSGDQHGGTGLGIVFPGSGSEPILNLNRT
ncbi:hypothetical protein FB451DRAFT_1190059 [Mycena latifolia]|nr:hypothetical protein FB451DRAFT_1190059 [Mycena latifolia]